jgi:tetratricopeptide (TPR) repeat protein
MTNSNNDGRFLNDIFRGVPAGYGLSREEQTLRATTQTLALLKDRLPTRSSDPYPQQQPNWAANVPPQVNITMPDYSRTMTPYLDDIAREQQATATGINSLASLGNEANEQRAKLVAQSRVANNQLESIDEKAFEAAYIRKAILSGMHQIRQEIENTGEEMGGELRRQTSLLDDIAKLEGTQTDSLYSINSGVHQMTQHQQGIREDLAGVNRHLDYGNQQRAQYATESNRRLDAGNVLLTRIADNLDHFEGSLDFFVINSMGIRKSLEGILDSLRNPPSNRADEIWAIGERARRSGKIEEAANMFGEGMKNDQTDPRPYYSLAMTALETGATDTARQFFVTGYNYARNYPGLNVDFLLQMARLGMILGHNELSRGLLEQAFAIDRTNIAAWYEIALVETKLKNYPLAVKTLNNLLYVARRQRGSSGYVLKIMHEPFFAPILKFLNQ